MLHGMHKQADREVGPRVLPNRLGELLAERKLKDVKLAAAVNVDQSTVYRWRTRLSPMSDTQKVKVALFLGVSVACLMGWSEDCNGHDDPDLAPAA